MIDMIKISKRSTRKEVCNSKLLLLISKLSSWSWDSLTTQPKMVNSASSKKYGEISWRVTMMQLAKCPKLTSKTLEEQFWTSIIRRWLIKIEKDLSSIPKLLVELMEDFCNSKLLRSSISQRLTVICSKTVRIRWQRTSERPIDKELLTNGKDMNTAFLRNSRRSRWEWPKHKEQIAHRN